MDARRATPHAQGPLVGAERCPPVGYRALAKTRDVDGRESRVERAPEAGAVYEDQTLYASWLGERQAERDQTTERVADERRRPHAQRVDERGDEPLEEGG